MINVLFRVLVVRYYKINAGFFLFLFMMLFGIVNGKDALNLHYGIMQAMVGSSYIFWVSALVWMLYSFKCVSFCFREMNDPTNSFLYELQSIDNRRQFGILFLCQVFLYLPVLVYCFTAAFIGFYNGLILLPVAMILFQPLMCLLATLSYFNRLNTTCRRPFISLPSFDLARRKHFLFYLLHYSLFYRKASFIGVKLFSLLLLQIMVAANRDTLSREAICVLMMFLISAHSMLPLYYVRFTEGPLSFLRNLPLSFLYRFGLFAVAYIILFLPELLFLVLNEHHVLTPGITLSLYAVAISQLLLYTAALYLPDMTTERYTMLVFALFFITLLLLASSDLWLLFAAEIIISISVFIKVYDRYEVTFNKDE